MKAVRIHAFGGPEVLVYEETSRPQPAAGEVLVRVQASSLNPVDRFVRSGFLQEMLNLSLPFTPGLDLAGVVEAVGSGVDSVAVGAAVYGYSNLMRQGALAEYAVVGASEIAARPASIDFVSAAAVPLAALTAWQGLFDVAGLNAGQTVLIHGAGGGVGSFAVQFAVAKGARVLGTAASDKHQLVRELGASQVIDKNTSFEEVATDVDVVFDNVGGDLLEPSLRVLKPGGIYVTPTGQPDPEKAKALGVRSSGMLAQANPAQLAEIAGLIDAGRVKPVVSAVYPLAEIRQAYAALEAGHLRGKIAIKVG